MLSKYNKALLVDICGERVLKDEKYYNDYCFAGASTLLMHICCISQIDREDIEGILRSKLSKDIYFMEKKVTALGLYILDVLKTLQIIY